MIKRIVMAAALVAACRGDKPAATSDNGSGSAVPAPGSGSAAPSTLAPDDEPQTRGP
jgi:hypothetical protein